MIENNKKQVLWEDLFVEESIDVKIEIIWSSLINLNVQPKILAGVLSLSLTLFSYLTLKLIGSDHLPIIISVGFNISQILMLISSALFLLWGIFALYQLRSKKVIEKYFGND